MREHKTEIEFLGNWLTVRISFEHTPACAGSFDEPPTPESFDIHELAFLTEDESGHELVNNADYLLSSVGVYDSLVELIKGEL